MKKKSGSYTIDLYNLPYAEPQAGQFIRNCSAVGEEICYFRILSARQVRVRVSRGEEARFALKVERLGALPGGSDIALTVHAYPKKPKEKIDRFNPLLPP